MENVVNEVVNNVTNSMVDEMEQKEVTELIKAQTESLIDPNPVPQTRTGSGILKDLGFAAGGLALGVALDRWLGPKIDRALANRKAKKAAKKAEKEAKKAAKQGKDQKDQKPAGENAAKFDIENAVPADFQIDDAE